MSNYGKRLAVFDVDGTINKTELYAVRAHMEAMRAFGSPEEIINEEFILSIFGMRADEYISMLLPNSDEQRRQEYLKYAERLEIEYMYKYGRAFDGIEQMLDSLHQMGWNTAVCSNASLRHINHVLEATGLASRIDAIQPLVRGMDKAGTLKLLLAEQKPELAVMTGDRMYDIEAAKASGIPSIGCKYGFAPEEAEKADYVVSSPYEIADIIGRLSDEYDKRIK